MSIDITQQNKKDCCGCGTCMLVCPTGAIEMVPMELGCLYPVVNKNKCIDCGLCEKHCSFGKNNENEPLAAYAAALNDKSMLKNSASGGVFVGLAKSFIEAGGVVFGCSMELIDETLVPMHICVDSCDDLWKLQGSKYVQSELGDCFLRVKQFLRDGRAVLFSGTPCQVSALKHFTREMDTSHLYTIDIVCHGVPSAKLFQEYVKTFKKKITAFSFRDKTFGWGLEAKYTYIHKNDIEKNQILTPNVSSYYSYFLQSEIYRESCYSCPYANLNRAGDITIGDFWGIEEEHPEYLSTNGGELKVEEGISAVLINSKKGEEIVDTYGNNLFLHKSCISKILKWNKQLNKPSMYSNKRNYIIEKHRALGYLGIERQFRTDLGLKYFSRILKLAVKQIKNEIKNIK